MKSIIILIILAQFFSLNTNGQTLLFYKSKKKGGYHFYEKQKLTLHLNDGTNHKGQIDSFTENQIILNTKKNGQVTVDNKNIIGFTTRRHIWYFGARMRSLIQYNKHCDLKGFNYKIESS